MFSGSSSLKNVYISNFNTTKVNKMNMLFNGCINLEYINMYNFVEGDSITINNTFYEVPNNLNFGVNNSANIPLINGELRNKNFTINDCSDN